MASAMPSTAEDAVQQQLRWETGNAELARRQMLELLWQGVRDGDRQCLGVAAELALPSQTALAAGGLFLLAVAAATGNGQLAGTAALTLSGQAAYVIGGLSIAQDSGTFLHALRFAPGFAVSRLKVLSRVATGRGARTWVRTQRGG